MLVITKHSILKTEGTNKEKDISIFSYPIYSLLSID